MLQGHDGGPYTEFKLEEHSEFSAYIMCPYIMYAHIRAEF